MFGKYDKFYLVAKAKTRSQTSAKMIPPGRIGQNTNSGIIISQNRKTNTVKIITQPAISTRAIGWKILLI